MGNSAFGSQQQALVDAHLADAIDAHDASAISILDSAGLYTGDDVEEIFAELGAWQDYTPVLTATTTNPTLGTGGVILGRYVKIGKTVLFRVKILFGSAGVNGGSGTYRVTHPSPAPDDDAWTVPIIGQVTIFDSSPTTFRIGTIQFGGVGTGYFVLQADSATANVAHNNPITFAANDQILIVGMYEVN